MKRLTNQENQFLAELYKRANASNSDQDWHRIDLFFEDMGIKYKFNPAEIVIDTNGRIFNATRCYKCGGIANSQNGIIYVRDKLSNTEKYRSYPVCYSCYKLYFPANVKKEVLGE